MLDTRPLKVFLCHASADKVAVRKLYQYLRDRKMDPWLDAEKLLPGQNWQVEIPKALYASDVIIICLSKSSVDKEGYVQKEIKFALDKALEMPDGRIFLIPARLEECELPHSLSAYHYVDLFEADGYRRLLRSLRIRAQQIGATKVSVEEDVVSPEAERLAQEKAERKRAEREAAKLDEREKADREAREKAERDAAAKAAREKIEREAREKLVREKAESDAAEKAKREAKVEPIVEKPVATKLPSWSIGLVSFAVLALIAWGISSLQASPMATQMPPATQTLFVKPVIATPTLDPALGVGSTMIRNDGMTLIFVPAGEFIMGAADEDPFAESNAKPQHTVYLDAFWIDQTEVTNKQYAACVSANQCTQPSDSSSFTRLSYYGNPKFDDYPVIYVSWYEAVAYCSWVESRLPTEAEWEKAARGEDARIYPWGNIKPSRSLLNFDEYISDTTAVGSYLNGQSPYGVYDMAGNVAEWINDWYSETYYQVSPSSNPPGPDTGQGRSIRGGSWGSPIEFISSSFRFGYYVQPYSDNGIGFRCARSIP